MTSSFRDRKVYELFDTIHCKIHTDPKPYYEALRRILTTRAIVTGKSTLRQMKRKLEALRVYYPNYEFFFAWFEETYRTYHPKHIPVTKDVNAKLTIADRENHIVLIQDAQSVNIREQEAVVKTPLSMKRRRWWLFYLA